jgi:nucleotide-binding universal stress UspA family protein
MRTYRRILVPVDGSPTSNKALVAALNIARDGDGRVRLVHVVDELGYLTGFEASGEVFTLLAQTGERVLADSAQIARSAGVDAETQFLDEPGVRLGDAVARAASEWQADLVVVGTHGRRGVQRALLGSGAEQIIRMAPVPVLVIRGDDGDAAATA